MSKQEFSELCHRPYKEQAVWFLNGFWPEMSQPGQAEKVWNVFQKFKELDEKKEEGTELDEFSSHRLLETFDETLSVIKMREALRVIDVDANGKMALLEYLVWKYNKTIPETVNSSQGDNQEEVARCEALLQQVQTAFVQVQEKLEQQRQAVLAADHALKEAQQAEAEVKAAEAELEAAIAELKAQEDAYNSKCQQLEARSTDTSIGVVTRNKAANELAQLKSEDPLPLRKAKITQEAALRRVQKARVAAEAATAEADAKKAALVEVQRQLEQRQAELEQKVQEAMDELNAAKKKGGPSHGSFWMMERQMYEMDAYQPSSKQKYDHKKPFTYQG